MIVIRHILILLAVILSPVYGLWIYCGMLADRAGQCRSPALMKGNQVNALK